MKLNKNIPETSVYEPSKSIGKRIARRTVHLRARRMVRLQLERPIVSFTFDDCPKSAVDNGVKKLEAMGWKSTIYIAAGLFGTTNGHHGLHIREADAVAAYEAGHEIGGHTYSHCDISEVTHDAAIADINKNRQVFQKLSLPLPTFAYPYGQTTAAAKKHLSQHYHGMRGIKSGAMQGRVDLNQIKSTPLFSGEPFNALIQQIKTLTPNSWLTIFTHDIRDSPSEWGCTPSEMDAVIEAVKNSGAEVKTVAGAIEKIKASEIRA